MKKRLFATIMAIILIVGTLFSLVACADNSDDGQPTSQKAYNMYVAYAEEQGETPLSYEDWLASIKGEKGDKGDKGEDGSTPVITISDDGYWVIDGTATQVKALATDGQTPYINSNGYWVINGQATEYKAIGSDGSTPVITINDSGYWVIDGVATETIAVGSKGETGATGEQGAQGLSAYQVWLTIAGNEGKSEEDFIASLKGDAGGNATVTISNDGYWVINGTTTESKAIGTNGITPHIGDGGYWYLGDTKTDYSAVPSVAINSDGNWTINNDDSGVRATGKSAYELYCESNEGDDLTLQEWLASLKGEKGDQGEQGEQGIQGEKGETGATGSAGQDGTNWYTGEGSPSDISAKEGDLYLDTKLKDIYKYVGTEWVFQCSLDDTLPIGIVENFEGYDSISSALNKFSYTNLNSETDMALVEADGNTSLKITQSADTTGFSLSLLSDVVTQYPLSEAYGFRFALSSDLLEAATVTVTIGSEGNYYQTKKYFYAKDSSGNSLNNATYMVCDFAGMALADGSSGTLDRAKIDTVKIEVAGEFTAQYTMTIDDLEFYSTEIGSMGVAWCADFSSTSAQTWSASQSNSGTAFTSLQENGTFTVSPTNSTQTQFQNKSVGYKNFQNVYAVKMKITATNVVSLHLRLLNGSNVGYKLTLSSISSGEQEVIFYLSNMEVHTSQPAGFKVQTIYMLITCGSSGGSITFSDIEFLIG